MRRAIILLLLTAPACLAAQAWLFPSGEGSISIGYQNAYVRKHAYSKGELGDAGHIMTQGLLLDADYTLGRRFAVKVGVPYLASEYNGSKPHVLPKSITLPGWTATDDGTFHGAFQDFRVGIRYNLVQKPLVVTPYFEAVLPSHPYVFFAHNAIGRDQREYHVGLNLGRRLDPILPKAYFQARYHYAFVQPVLGIAPNRSDSELQIGYFVTPRLSVMALGTAALAHSGIRQNLVGWPTYLTDEQYLHHDQISRMGLIDVGGGGLYSLNQSMSIYASLVTAVWARSTHKLTTGITVGISWKIKPKFGRREGAHAALQEDDSPRAVETLRCACAAASAH